MSLNLKRHKLLGILAKQRNDSELKKAEYNAFGVPFERIYKELNCNEDELKLITSELYTSEEIGYYDSYGIIGLYVKRDGLTAYSNKKYKKLYWKRITDLTKNFVQIAIPILSLLIAFVALTIKIENLNTSTEKRLKNAEKQIQALQEQLNHHHNQQPEFEKKDTDSISIN